jgi:CheY-like chemotaxis protein
MPPGEGRIELRAAAEGGDAVLVVRDNGIGIAPELLPSVFDLFVQGPQARDRSEGGLGLGLAIVQNLVRLHGGSVLAHSDGLGRGAEIAVRLPLALRAHHGQTAPASAPTRAGDGLRVLVVDDNVDAAESLADLLRDGGYDVAIAHDGAAALAKARETAFDFVFLDIALPNGLDGYEVARRMRGDHRLRNVTLIALTGFGQEEDRRRAVDAGFDHYLVKPADPAAVRRLLAARS